MSDRIVAQVILAGAPSSRGEPITAENVHRFQAPERVVSDARRRLEERGFAVRDVGPTSFAIEGTRAQFESVFDARLETTSKPVDVAGREQASEYTRAASPLRVPDDLSDVVAEVVLATPPDFYP
jgi:hypothetical protein